MKGRAVPTTGENPKRAIKVNMLVSHNRDGENHDGSVRGEQMMQQAEKNEDSDTQSARRGDDDVEVISTKAVIVQNIQMIVERRSRRTTRS